MKIQDAMIDEEIERIEREEIEAPPSPQERTLINAIEEEEYAKRVAESESREQDLSEGWLPEKN